MDQNLDSVISVMARYNISYLCFASIYLPDQSLCSIFSVLEEWLKWCLIFKHVSCFGSLMFRWKITEFCTFSSLSFYRWALFYCSGINCFCSLKIVRTPQISIRGLEGQSICVLNWLTYGLFYLLFISNLQFVWWD